MEHRRSLFCQAKPTHTRTIGRRRTDAFQHVVLVITPLSTVHSSPHLPSYYSGVFIPASLSLTVVVVVVSNTVCAKPRRGVGKGGCAKFGGALLPVPSIQAMARSVMFQPGNISQETWCSWRKDFDSSPRLAHISTRRKRKIGLMTGTRCPFRRFGTQRKDAMVEVVKVVLESVQESFWWMTAGDSQGCNS